MTLYNDLPEVTKRAILTLRALDEVFREQEEAARAEARELLRKADVLQMAQVRMRNGITYPDAELLSLPLGRKDAEALVTAGPDALRAVYNAVYDNNNNNNNNEDDHE